MLIRRRADILTSEITDESSYWNRREFLQAAGIGLAAVGFMPRELARFGQADEDKLTPYEDVTGYNNFYEFGTDKDDPKAERRQLQDSALEDRGCG